MWTQETSPCHDCGNDLTLVTDGRLAYVYVEGSRYGETTQVWRDGLLLVTDCPVSIGWHSDTPRCMGRVEWIGEGRSLDYANQGIGWTKLAEPILASMEEAR